MGPHGRYSVLAKVADGGMAEIFLATLHGAAGFNRLVVLKRVLPKVAADAAFRQGLIDEASIAMRLQHSNIVQVLDVGEAAGNTFLVLELVDGWSLAQLLKRAKEAKQPLPPALVVFITIEMCRGLAYAHNRTENGVPMDIVHRDISPQNVLVSAEGEVKLTDFGIARASTREGQTGVGLVKGKPNFMSPEQARNQELDARSDLFAVGTLLYMALTGELPFRGKNDLETMLKVRDGRFTPLSKLDPTLPKPLIRVVNKLLKKDPEDRFATADELLVALEKVQREALEPMGSTELKAWLHALTKKDGVKPISSRLEGLAPVPQQPPPLPPSRDKQPTDVVQRADTQPPTSGEWIELSDVHLEPNFPSEIKKAKQKKPKKKRSAAWGFLLLGLTAFAAWWLHFREQGPAPSPVTELPTPPPSVDEPEVSEAVVAPTRPTEVPVVVAPPEPVVEPAVDAGVPEPVADAGGFEVVTPEAPPDVMPEPVKPPEPKVVEAPKPEPVKPEPVKPEPKHEPAKPEPKSVPPDHRTASPTPKTNPTPTTPVRPTPLKPEDDVQVVYIFSEPSGGTVKVGKKPLGQTPGNYRFRVGTMFDVTVEKPGYIPLTRRFTVRAQPGQRLKFSLSKN